MAAAAVLTLGSGWAALTIAKKQMGPPPLEVAQDLSTVVVDRKGRLLRAFTTSSDRWRLPVSVADVDKRYLSILFAFEDKNFRKHHGVDARAIGRAALQLARHGRIVSGASTLTMQVARLIEERHERSATGKLRQIVRALQIEEKLSKDEILNLYLRFAPFGGNLEGVRAASLAYFGKEPKRLSVGEAALLVALPQSPEARRPDRHPGSAVRARARVLDRAVAGGVISRAEADRARTEPMPKLRRAFPLVAPHLTEAEVAAAPTERAHRLTIDRALQESLETLARQQTALLGPRLSSAILVADHQTGEILASVGSADYLDETRFGSIDMVEAVRSPGSTLKPFVYGLSFELGLAHPETLIEDRPVRFGSYTPKNFDEDFRGTVTIRSALAHSLNIPAVKTLDRVGPARFVARLKRAGFSPQFAQSTEPSLAVALGGVGFTLKDMAGLYTGLARGGSPIALVHRQKDIEAAGALLLKGQSERRPRHLLSPIAAWYVTDILKDAPPPAYARGGRIAYKTGTSYGYRDAWAIGYDGRHVVAVWVGRPDNASTPGLMGHGAAAPMLFDAFARIGAQRAPLPSAPAGTLRVAGSELPPPLKRFAEPGQRRTSGPYLERTLAIAFPPDRAEVEVEAASDTAAPDPLMLKAEGGTLPLTWLVDGKPVGAAAHRRDLVWQPDGRGFYKLSVIDAHGQVDRVTVRLR
ncbi:MAG: penicillin-binding protein 1C [Hyphomicrobiaceae bacterium]|nr:penicillin-binding protein 1C [Hyphomicrobiaceae bacterium]